VSEPNTELATRAVEVTHPVTGEVLNLAEESLEQLAEMIVDLQEHRVRLADFERAVSDVMVAYLDRSALWTMRVGDPTGARQLEIKAPSPEAGQAAYPVDALVPMLKSLIADGVISPDAASKACARQLTLSLEVPWDADLTELADTVKGAVGIQIAGVAVDVVAASPVEKPIQAGIKALRKIPGAVDELDRVKVTLDQGPRRATVKVKVRGS
jgi:hypothetical protein